MKKLLWITLISLLLVGCGNNTDDKTDKKENHSETSQSTVDKMNDITEQLLTASYTIDDIKKTEVYKKHISKELRDKLSVQNQSGDATNPLKKEIENITVFTNEDDLSAMYEIDLKVTNEKARAKEETTRYGKVKFVKEGKNLKVNHAEEVVSYPSSTR